MPGTRVSINVASTRFSALLHPIITIQAGRGSHHLEMRDMCRNEGLGFSVSLHQDCGALALGRGDQMILAKGPSPAETL